MKDIQQLIKKNNQGGGYGNIFPLTFLDAVKDKATGAILKDILAGFNVYFLAYTGSPETTRLTVPTLLRRRGLIIVYITYDDLLITEQYTAVPIDNITWQNSNNWKQLWDQSQMEDFQNKSVRYGYNVTAFGMKGGTHTIETAVNDVPSPVRVLGHKITFAEQDRSWVTYQFQSLALADYTDPTKWVKLEGIHNVQTLNITNQPDEEDITTNGGELLKFADKEYSTESFSGLGRVFLRKNIVGEVNILTQDMLSKTDTIYHIQYEYDLNGNTIFMPDNCVLLFEGGSLKNGKLVGDNYNIQSPLNKVFDNITFTGKAVYNLYEVDWFVGNYTNGVQDVPENDAHDELEQCFNSGIKNVRFNNNKYFYTSKTIYVRNEDAGIGLNIIGNYTSIIHQAATTTSLIPPCIYSNTVVTLIDYNLTQSEHFTKIGGFKLYCSVPFQDSNSTTPILNIHNQGATNSSYGIDIDVSIQNKLLHVDNFKGIAPADIGSYIGVLVTSVDKGISFVNLGGEYTGLWTAFMANATGSGFVTDIVYNNYVSNCFYGAINPLASEWQSIRGQYQSAPLWTPEEREPYFKLGNTNVLVQAWIWDCRVNKGGLYTSYFDVSANTILGSSYLPDQTNYYVFGDSGYRPARDFVTKSIINTTSILTGLEYNPVYGEGTTTSGIPSYYVNSSSLQVIEGTFDPENPEGTEDQNTLDIKQLCNNYLDITNSKNLIRPRIDETLGGAFLSKSDIPYTNWYIKYNITMASVLICDNMLDIVSQSLYFDTYLFLKDKNGNRTQIGYYKSYQTERKGGISYFKLYNSFNSLPTDFLSVATIEFVFTPSVTLGSNIPLPVIAAFTPSGNEFNSFGGKVFNDTRLEGLFIENIRQTKGNKTYKTTLYGNSKVESAISLSTTYQTLFILSMPSTNMGNTTIKLSDAYGKYSYILEGKTLTQYVKNTMAANVRITTGSQGGRFIVKVEVVRGSSTPTNMCVFDKIINVGCFVPLIFLPVDSVLNLTDETVVEHLGERQYGNTRPTLAAYQTGQMFFDTTLVKPIWWTGTAWVDATGATV